jgi:hypothetical protein
MRPSNFSLLEDPASNCAATRLLEAELSGELAAN